MLGYSLRMLPMHLPQHSQSSRQPIQKICKQSKWLFFNHICWLTSSQTSIYLLLTQALQQVDTNQSQNRESLLLTVNTSNSIISCCTLLQTTAIVLNKFVTKIVTLRVTLYKRQIVCVHTKMKRFSVLRVNVNFGSFDCR